MGAEQLPGRRGTGRDFVHLPLSFRAFCTDVLRLPLPTETGGFPAAVQDAVMGADLQEPIASLMLRTVRPETVRLLWDIIAGDVQEAGRDKTATFS